MKESIDNEVKVLALEIADRGFPPAVMVDKLVAMYSMLKDEQNDLDEQIKELQKKKKKLDQIKSMADAIIKKGAMKEYNGFESKITVVSSAPFLEIEPGAEKNIPEKYFEVIPAQKKLKKKELMQDYRATGELPDGISVKQSTYVKMHQIKSQESAN
ncbi:MAG: siphovirus Gp157 family protein [Desulfobacterales bacterium]